MSEVTIVAALIGGLISFLSPCVLPLVPPYLVYLAGASARGLSDAASQRRVMWSTVLASAVFVAGFSTVFVALGAGANVVGSFLRIYTGELTIVAGVVIIVMGLHFLGVTRMAGLMRQARFDAKQPVSLPGAYVMGLAFAFGWSPCIGPILAAIVAIAATEATIAKGATLLAVYSLGLGLPFIAAAFAAQPFAAFAGRFRSRLHQVERVAGGLLVLTGIAFIAGVMPRAGAWLLTTFPVLGQVG